MYDLSVKHLIMTYRYWMEISKKDSENGWQSWKKEDFIKHPSNMTVCFVTLDADKLTFILLKA